VARVAVCGRQQVARRLLGLMVLVVGVQVDLVALVLLVEVCQAARRSIA